MINKIYYLASPYNNNDENIRNNNLKIVTEVVGKLLENKIPVISPIIHNIAITKYKDIGLGWDIWNFQDKALLKACGNLLILAIPGWENSKGIKSEMDFALENEIPTRFLDLDNIENFIEEECKERNIKTPKPKLTLVK